MEQWVRIHDLHRMDDSACRDPVQQKVFGRIGGYHDPFSNGIARSDVELFGSGDHSAGACAALVPVLQSYWLTIHVSMEAGSYGFLALGAVIGLINLILMIFLTQKNEKRVHRLVKEMSYLSEMTLIGGLTMISIGTYLGGVWANESWGRYWGWDAKETWALVTILIYAFILHMRLIPKMQGLFAYNVSSLFGLASVIMTYYGVNYYLSGLHSYAAGDPVPVPDWVFITAGLFLAIGVVAYWRKRKFTLIK